MVTPDEYLGILLVKPLNTANISIQYTVNSFPCPSVQWIFNGTNIKNDTPTSSYLITDPCRQEFFFEKINYFLIIMDNLTMNLSGYYWAVFNNGISSPTISPLIFVTVPGKKMDTLHTYNG